MRFKHRDSPYTRDDIVYECNKDILYDNVNDVDVTIAEAVVWLIPFTVAHLVTTVVDLEPSQPCTGIVVAMDQSKTYSSQ